MPSSSEGSWVSENVKPQSMVRSRIDNKSRRVREQKRSRGKKRGFVVNGTIENGSIRNNLKKVA